jgi:hypothetical protein
MPDIISIQQAAANALATWLATELPDVTLSNRWPEPTVPLGPKTVTVLLAGAADDDILDPQVESQINTELLPTAIYTYRLRCRRQNLQLDVFTQYDVHRDDIMARLDKALNASETRTLGPSFPAAPTRNGIVLALADGWVGMADFLFEGPNLSDNPESQQQTDYRATYRGYVDVMLTYTTETPVARMAVIELLQRAHEAPRAGLLATDVATATADGATYTQLLPTETP